jgi:hypothetical protein
VASPASYEEHVAAIAAATKEEAVAERRLAEATTAHNAAIDRRVEAERAFRGYHRARIHSNLSEGAPA